MAGRRIFAQYKHDDGDEEADEEEEADEVGARWRYE